MGLSGRMTIILMAIYSIPSLAATRYVSDVLYIPLSKNQDGGTILKHIKSGTVVTQLEDASTGDYVKVTVQDESKTTGWVKSRYLLNEPTARVELSQLKDSMKSLETQQKPLATTVMELKAKLETISQEKIALEHQKIALESKLKEIRNASADTLAIHEKNTSLLQDKSLLTMKLKNIENENLTLSSNQRNEGIKLGLIAVAIGAIAGFLLPYVKPRGRRHQGVRLR